MEDNTMPQQEDYLGTIPVGKLGIIALPGCEKIAEKYECKAYHLREPVLTDLFPISLNIGKQNIVFYRDDRDIEELLSIQRDKNELQKNGKYIGPDRYAIAIRYAHLLSYDDDAITRYLKNNHERE